ncbi:hypothetical protein ACFL4Z_01960 [candidate division KSB1 bacterium]
MPAPINPVQGVKGTKPVTQTRTKKAQPQKRAQNTKPKTKATTNPSAKGRKVNITA